jgi:hypothetical protein
MRKLALFVLLLSLAACQNTKCQSAVAENCDARFPGYDACRDFYLRGTTPHVALSHWDVSTGRGAFLATGAEAAAASTGDPSYHR